MKKYLAIASLIVTLSLAGLYGYFIHSFSIESAPESGDIKHQAFTIDNTRRGFQYYISDKLQPSASLLFVLHGSMGSGDQARWQTAYGFEHIATEENLIVVYPDGFERHWNDCRASASYAANKQDINEQAFFSRMIGYFTEQYDIDPGSVFATGMSNGGHMTYKLGLTMPESFTAIAPIIANMPETDNLDCTPKEQPISVAILNGLQDSINPFDGGKVVLLGNDSRGTVLSSNESIDYWISLATHKPVEPTLSLLGNSAKLEQWQVDNYQFKLFHLTDTGHVIASSKVRFGALFGPNDSGVEAVDEIWEFFTTVNSLKQRDQRLGTEAIAQEQQ